MTDRSAKRDHGVVARNSEYARYEGVAKPSYHLAEQAGREEFDDDFRVRTCDMAAWFEGGEADKSAFAAQLGAALEEIGFAILVGHGVDPALHQRSHDAIARFFRGFFEIPPDQRRRYRAARHGSVNQGWFPVKETSDIHPDLVEGWVFCRRAFDFDGTRSPDALREFWPDPAFEPVFRAHVQAHEPLVSGIMRAILRHLEVDEHHYDARLADGAFGLRLNWYPPVAAEDAAAGGGRMLGHEDIDLFTLVPAPPVEGLQIRHRTSGKWVRLQAPPGAIVLNTGDYMQRITNDRLPSTTHRVALPRRLEDRQRGRASIPLAVYVRERDVLEVLPGLGPPRYPPIAAIDFHTGITAKYDGDDYRSTGADD